MAEETTNSNAVMESSYSSAVGGVRTSTSSTDVIFVFKITIIKISLISVTIGLFCTL